MTEENNSSNKNKRTKAHCNKCVSKTHHWIKVTYTQSGSDEYTYWSDTYDILECCGCETITIRKQVRFSEWDHYQLDPRTGSEILIPGIKESFYPPALSKKEPRWLDDLDDETLTNILREIYTAIEAGSRFLATAGTRTALDRVMTLKVGDIGGFEQKLSKMKELGFIGDNEHELLSVMVDAGHAAAHRGWAPDFDKLEIILDTLENLIQRLFILDAQALKKHIPKRATIPAKPMPVEDI